MLITAALVMKLREKTGAPMMECKKYLILANGDMDLATSEMRKAGQAKADKIANSNRIAAEGVISIATSNDKRSAVIIEINTETDFAAREENFLKFAENVTLTALNYEDIKDISTLNKVNLENSDNSVEHEKQQLTAKLGENIQLRRLEKIHCDSGVVGSYLHGSRIGVIIALKNGDETLAKDIAMHIAASRPMVVNREQVPADVIATERDIFTAQARESGKPQEIIDKMIEGRINKFIDEVSLLGQPFVKNPDIKVSQLLKEKNAEVTSFVRFEVGEGIAKKEDNFVKDVMAQVRD